jgi:hypothetical protein
VLAELSNLTEDFNKKPSILVLEGGYPGTVYGVDAYMEYRGLKSRSHEGPAVSGSVQTSCEHYLDDRVRLLLAAYVNGGWNEGQRLVSITYSFGDRGVNLLIVMLVSTSFEWAAMQEALQSPGENQELCKVPYCISKILNASS